MVSEKTFFSIKLVLRAWGPKDSLFSPPDVDYQLNSLQTKNTIYLEKAMLIFIPVKKNPEELL